MQRVEAVLHAARRRQAHVYLSSINLGEILYVSERERGLPLVQRVLAAIEQMPISIVEAMRERVMAATHIKANNRLSYADAFAVAAAQEFNAVVLTGDPEYVTVERAGLITVEWLFHPGLPHARS